MKRYRVVKQIILDFVTHNDQYGRYVEQSENTILEVDESTIWVIENGKRAEAINTVILFKYLLRDGKIEEIK